MEQARPIKEKSSHKQSFLMIGHKWTLEKTETVEEKKKESMMNETTKSLMDLPVELLVKIFNFLPNHHHDIRCGISLTCKKFHEICKDESLVLVKDLCIYGDKQLSYGLRDFEAVSGIIIRSQDLTSLKIKALNLDTAKQLVRIALRDCPKLIHLEIVEIPEMESG